MALFTQKAPLSSMVAAPQLSAADQARQSAIRAAGYTGAFGAGGADAFLQQKFGSTATPVASTQGSTTSTTATSQAAPATPQVTWNKDVATSVGQLLGLLQPGQVATGGFLDAKVKAASPELQAEYARLANGIQQGTMTQDDLVNHFIERQATAASKDPEYGSLAKAPFRTFTPFAEKAPAYKPFAMSDFMASPDYEFRKEEGQRAIDRAGSARGNFYSGGALKEAARFGSDLASGEFNQARGNYVQDYGIKAGEYGDAYNRYNQDFGTGYGQAAGDSDRIYNRFAGLANSGAGSAGAAVSNNTNNSNIVGSTLAAQAQNTANSQIAGSNNITQLLANSFGTSSYKRKTP